eukprot:1010217-Amphidinium_carterae.2
MIALLLVLLLVRAFACELRLIAKSWVTAFKTLNAVNPSMQMPRANREQHCGLVLQRMSHSSPSKTSGKPKPSRKFTENCCNVMNPPTY